MTTTPSDPRGSRIGELAYLAATHPDLLGGGILLIVLGTLKLQKARGCEFARQILWEEYRSLLPDELQDQVPETPPI